MTRVKGRRAGSLRLLLGVVALVPLSLSAPALAAGPVPVHEVGLTPREGGSATAFSVQLPAGASCPGDSAHDGYRVNSYMVPASLDPTEVTYDGAGPTPYAYDSYADFRQPLYETNSNSFVAIQTADATTPGQPGAIINLPEFDFAVYPPGRPPAGHYHLGIACTLLKQIVTVWDTEIVISAAADDAAQIRWTAVGPAGDTTSADSNLPAATVVAAGAFAIAAIAGSTLLIRRRRQPQPTTTSLEDA